MNNYELQDAIDKTHELLMRTSPRLPLFNNYQNHLETLLGIQRMYFLNDQSEYDQWMENSYTSIQDFITYLDQIDSALKGSDVMIRWDLLRKRAEKLVDEYHSFVGDGDV